MIKSFFFKGLILSILLLLFIYSYNKLTNNNYFPPFYDNINSTDVTPVLLKGDTIEQSFYSKYDGKYIEFLISNNHRINNDILDLCVIDIHQDSILFHKKLTSSDILRFGPNEFFYVIQVPLKKERNYKIRFISLKGKKKDGFSFHYYKSKKPSSFKLQNKIYYNCHLTLRPIYYPKEEKVIIGTGVILLTVCICSILFALYLLLYVWYAKIKKVLRLTVRQTKVKLTFTLFRIRKLSLEHAFIFIALFFGLIINAIIPNGDVFDGNTHIYSAYSLAKGGSVMHIQGKIYPSAFPHYHSIGGNVVVVNDDSLKGPEKLIIPAMYTRILKDDKKTYNKVYLKKNDFRKDNLSHAGKIPHATFLDHFFPSLGVHISDFLFKVIGMKYKVSAYLQTMNILALLGYILLCFLAIKHVKYYKELFFTLCLTPTILYTASMITYDNINFSFTLLFIAFLINKIFHKKQPFSKKDSILYLLFCIGLAFLKGIYFPVMFFILLVPTFKLRLIKKFFLCLSGFILFALSLSLFKYNLANELHFEPKHNENSISLNDENPSLATPLNNTDYVKNNPITFLGNLLGNIIYSKDVYLLEAFSVIGGALSNKMPNTLIYVFIFLSVYSLIIAKVPKGNVFFFSIFCLLIFFATYSIVCYFFYKGLSSRDFPVAYYRIWGVMGRYFWPVLILIPLGLKLKRNFIFKIPKSSLLSHRMLLVFANILILMVYVLFTFLRYHSSSDISMYN